MSKVQLTIHQLLNKSKIK